jgi:uncharacterized protein
MSRHRLLAIVVAGVTLVLAGSGTASISPGLVVSQVYGGGGNSGATLTNDYIELFNRGTSTVNIAGWSVQYASSSGSTWQVTAISGTVAPGQYYLVQEAQGAGGTTPLPTPDALGSISMSATSGKVALVDSTTTLSGSCPTSTSIVDLVGYGSANCYEGSAAAPGLSNTAAALRDGDGCTDTSDNADDFASGTPDPRNSASPLHACGDAAPSVASTTPGDAATSVPLDAEVSITFSEPVDVAGSWYTLACSLSGSHTAAVSGGPTTYTLDPDTDFTAGDSCDVTVLAAQVTDQDTDDPPDAMTADYAFSFSTGSSCALPYTHIYAIQGAGASAAITGTVTTQGVVVGDYEGPSPALRGFYLQDEAGDGDAATSDGIFVFNGDDDSVSLGDVVRVSGSVGEFQDQTQISSVSSIDSCGTASVAPTDVTLPFSSADFPERYEGMLVRLPQTLAVTEHFQLGRFGQVVMSPDGRLPQPTSIAEPGASAQAQQAANDLNRIIVDDQLNDQNPDPILFGLLGNPLSASNTLRGGDTATGIVGVMTYTWAGNGASGNAYRVRPVGALGGGVPSFAPANPRPATPDAVGGSIRVASFNVLNYFNTFDGSPDTADNCTNGVGGAATDCRGADTAAEFDRQWPKTVSAILGLDADVVGVIEIENDGYGPTSAIQDLVDRLNDAAGAGTYSFVDVDAATGEVNALGLDAIKVGLLYTPATVTPVGDTAALNSVEFVNGGDSDLRNRPSLAQAFEVNDTAARFIVDVNHFKSKGSACDVPDAGDGQGNCNAVRTNAANLLATWLAGDPTGTGDPDVLVMGDLNSYAQEDPIAALEGAGYANLIESHDGPSAYSYVFDGQWGYLDHALASDGLADRATGVTEWHINADEPSVLDYNTDFKSPGQITDLYAPDRYRSSDHDPVLIGLDLCEAIPPTLEVGVDPDTLWPPNHKYVDVTASVVASDTFDPNPTVELVSVTSSEADDAPGVGDGATTDDVVVVDDTMFRLRAERAGTGSGRVYTITYRATDDCGNTTTESATVTVPTEQR